MNSFKKIFRNIVAILCLLIGVIGGFIPIFQGWVFVLLGFILLDFKKKEHYEEKILSILSKTKIGSKLSNFWKRIKEKNRSVIDEGNKEKVKDIYKNINSNK